jgi:hypothetical protein
MEKKISNFHIRTAPITANATSDVFQCKGFKNLLLTIQQFVISGTNPTLDISVIGYNDAGDTLLLDVFPTFFSSMMGNIHLRVDVDNYTAVQLSYTVTGTNPSYDGRIMGALSI